MQNEQDNQISAYTDAVYVWDIDKAHRIFEAMDNSTQIELLRRGYGATWLITQWFRLWPEDEERIEAIAEELAEQFPPSKVVVA